MIIIIRISNESILFFFDLFLNLKSNENVFFQLFYSFFSRLLHPDLQEWDILLSTMTSIIAVIGKLTYQLFSRTVKTTVILFYNLLIIVFFIFSIDKFLLQKIVIKSFVTIYLNYDNLTLFSQIYLKIYYFK